MRYKGIFEDINENKYTVDIVTNNDMTKEEEITLGSQPFTISYEGGGDTLYKPIKYSSATVTIITKDLKRDIYTGANQGTQITLMNEQTKSYVFCGYVTPNAYNQQYSGTEETLELETVDAISTLKNVDYTSIGEECDVVCFTDIFCHCLKKANLINKIHIANAIEKQNENSVTFLDELFISERNFFDEDLKPMKCSEVLEQLCQYLNMTLFVKGLEAYLIDYDAIASDLFNVEYDTFIITHNVIAYLGKKDEQNVKTITADSFKGSNGNLSIDNCYNKVTVVADSFGGDDELIDIFEGDDLENISCPNDRDGFLIDNAYTGDSKKYKNNKDNKYLYYRVLRQKGIEQTYYKKSGSTWVITDEYPTDYKGLKEYAGASLFQWGVSAEPKYKMEKALAQPQNDINFTNTILFHTQNLVWNNMLGQPISAEAFRLRPFNKPLVTNDDSYLYINCTSVWRTIQRYHTADSYKGEKWKPQNYPFFKFVIWNRKTNSFVEWFNSNDIETKKTAVWTAYDEFHPVWDYAELKFFLESPTWKDKKVWDTLENMIDKKLNVLSNIDYTMGLNGLNGAIFKLPPATNIADIELIIYLPSLPDWNILFDDTDDIPPLHAVIWEDFECKVVTPSAKNKIKLTEDEDEENTKYENVIDDAWVEELGEINFSVNTNDGETCSYSNVFQLDENGQLKCADKLKNLALGEELRQEEMLIFRIVKQYKAPRIKLNFELNNNFDMCDKVIYPSQEKDKNFIIDSMEIDVENATTNITLIEKV